MFSTNIGFGKELYKKVEALCSEIGEMDATFRWKIRRWTVNKKYEYVLTVESESRDQAFKRGELLTKKYLQGAGLLYWVKTF